MQYSNKPFIVDRDGQSQFGRFPQPFMAANVAESTILDYAPWLRLPTRWNRWLRALRLKEWHFLSLNHDEIFVAFAVAQLGYVSNLFVYCFDKKTNQMLEWGERFLLGRNLEFGASSIDGETRWQSKTCALNIVNQEKGWTISLDVGRPGKKLSAEVFLQRDEAMALVYPLAGSRTGYTHKEVGNQVEGRLNLNGHEYLVNPRNCLGASDWSRSFSNRITEWYFACFAGMSAKGHRIGLNLSRLIYDDPQGISQENTVWIDGKSFQIGQAIFVLPEQKSLATKVWRIEGFDWQDGTKACLHLEFEPLGARRENVSLGVLTSKFTQVFGYYSGVISLGQHSYRIAKSFGVAEKHYSKW